MFKYGGVEQWIILVAVAAGVLACSSGTHQPAPVRSASKDYSDYNRDALTGTSYTVQQGDTLFSIAWQSGTDFTVLASLNNIYHPYTIYKGQRLQLKPKISNKKHAPTKTSPQLNTSSHQEKKLDKRHENTVDSKPAQGYRQSQAGQDSYKALIEPSPKQVEVQWFWPTQGNVISRFSAAKTGYKGIDIDGVFGQSVVAAGDGSVVYAGSGLRGYGELIIIKHSDQFLSAYAHNSRLRVKEGQWVKAGQLIANMGSTGTDSVKLHFEIRLKGQPVDPIRYLPKLKQ